MPPRLTAQAMRWVKRIAIALAAITVVLVVAGWVVLQQPQFGARMSGARLERAKANPQYRDGRFLNVPPETPTSLAALGDYLVRQFSGNEVREPPGPLPVLAVDKAALAAAPAPSGLRAFWIGHASTYVEIDGLRLLMDPVFAERVSPLPVGPRRFHPPPIALADLPPIDAVLIQEIGSRFGPFDIAFIKIGAYGPGAAWVDIHMPPEQAVQVSRDVRAKRMFPVHWSTFNLAYHDWDEPIRRAVAEARRAGVELVTPRLGEWVDADREFQSTPWWEAVR